MTFFYVSEIHKMNYSKFFFMNKFLCKQNTHTYIHTKRERGRIGNVYILIIARDHFFKMLIPLYDILKNILQIYWLHIHAYLCPKYGEVINLFFYTSCCISLICILLQCSCDCLLSKCKILLHHAFFSIND